MLKKLNDYENIKVNDGTKFELGGKECIIKNVKPFQYGGAEKLSLEIDIASGLDKDYYQKKYDERPDTAKFWDDGATISVHADAESIKDEKERNKAKSYFKGIITAIESYNPGYKFNWDEQTLINKKLNANFSLKEYIGNESKIYTKPQISRFINSKENFKKDYIPQVKTIDNQYVEYEDYKKNKTSSTPATNEIDPFASIVEYDNSAIDL